MPTMAEPIFESITTMDQAEFATWIEQRSDWDVHRYELLNGRVVMTPPAGWPHSENEVSVVVVLHDFVRANGGGRVLGSSQGFELPTGDTVAADASFVSDVRWSAAPPPEREKFLRVVPDLVVEVLSKSTASRDRGEKKAIYAAAGVREYWLVDSRARTLTVFLASAGHFDGGRSFGEHEAFASTVLAGLVVDVARLF